jgi:hypothetical protein
VNLGKTVVFAAMLALATASVFASDTEALRALHEKVMRAHRESNVELVLEDDADEAVVAGRGVVSRPTREDRRTRMGPYLKSTVFEVYRDMVDPVVEVSADGSLGWVIVQIEARGVQTDAEGKKEPLAFQSSWIELYRKSDGRWKRIGNVSNFKE